LLAHVLQGLSPTLTYLEKYNIEETKTACGWVFDLWENRGFDSRDRKSADDLSLYSRLLVCSMFVHAVSVLDHVWSCCI